MQSVLYGDEEEILAECKSALDKLPESYLGQLLAKQYLYDVRQVLGLDKSRDNSITSLAAMWFLQDDFRFEPPDGWGDSWDVSEECAQNTWHEAFSGLVRHDEWYLIGVVKSVAAILDICGEHSSTEAAEIADWVGSILEAERTYMSCAVALSITDPVELCGAYGDSDFECCDWHVANRAKNDSLRRLWEIYFDRPFDIYMHSSRSSSGYRYTMAVHKNSGVIDPGLLMDGIGDWLMDNDRVDDGDTAPWAGSTLYLLAHAELGVRSRACVLYGHSCGISHDEYSMCPEFDKVYKW